MDTPEMILLLILGVVALGPCRARCRAATLNTAQTVCLGHAS